MRNNATGVAPVPGHIAIIMDGNRRWAQQRGLPPLAGHLAGRESLRRIIKQAEQYRLGFLTVYSFSTENWNRSEDEVKSLLELFEQVVNEETPVLHKKGIRMRHLGRRDAFSPSLVDALDRSEKLTCTNPGMTFSYAFDYGARAEIADAAQRIVRDRIPAGEVTEKLFSRYLYTDGLPDVDLLIRTGGEFRLSNFLMWQTAYSELYFTTVLWPDFDENHLDEALEFYSQRQRRFGAG